MSAAAECSNKSGPPGAKGDPLYGIQKLLRAGAEKLTDKQWTRFENAIAAHDAHFAVYVAWSCAQQFRIDLPPP
jgi:transposase